MKTQIYIVGVIMLALLAACGSGKVSDSRTRHEFMQGPVKFSLREVEGLSMYPADSVPWVNTKLMNTADGGVIAYYFVDGMEASLRAPNIRLEYFSKKLPNCSTPDSVIWGIKEQLKGRGAIVTEENKKIKTYSGKKAFTLEVDAPPFQVDSLLYDRRSLYWAYIDQGEYYLGLHLAAVERGKYDQVLPMFKELVKTYEE